MLDSFGFSSSSFLSNSGPLGFLSTSSSLRPQKSKFRHEPQQEPHNKQAVERRVKTQAPHAAEAATQAPHAKEAVGVSESECQ